MFKYVVLEKETNEPDIQKGKRISPYYKGSYEPYFECPFKKKPYGVVTLWRGWLDGVRVSRLGWSKCNEKDEFDLQDGLIIAKSREISPRDVLDERKEEIPHDVAKVIKRMAAVELGYRT